MGGIIEEKKTIWFVHLKEPLGRTKVIPVYYWETFRDPFLRVVPVDEDRFGDNVLIPGSNIIMVLKEREN